MSPPTRPDTGTPDPGTSVRAAALRPGMQTVMAGCLLVLAAAVILYALQAGRAMLAPTAVAGLVALAFSPAHGWMERRGLPSALAAAIIVLGLVGLVAATVYTLLPSYEEWRYRFPRLLDQLGDTVEKVGETVQEAVDEVQKSTNTVPAEGAAEPIPDPIKAVSESMASVILKAPGVAATTLYGVFLTFFLLADRRLVFRAFTSIMARTLTGRRRIARSLRALHHDLAFYFFVLTLINAGLGVATMLVFMAIGMPNPAIWGVCMAVLNFIPYLGPAIMNALVFAVALVAHGSLELALISVGSLMALNLFEGQLITPLLIGRRFMLSSLAVFIGVAFGAWLWGAIGALLSTPVLIIARAAYTHFRQEDSA